MSGPLPLDLEGFSTRIRARRRELHLPARRVARAAGLSPSYLAVLEKGINPQTERPSRPSLDVVTRLAQELALDEAELLTLAGYDPAEAQDRRARKGDGVILAGGLPDASRLVAAFVKQAQFFKATLAVALLTTPDRNEILLCRLADGPYRGRLQFPAGYIEPERTAWEINPRLKAEFEVQRHLHLDPAKDLDLVKCLTCDTQYCTPNLGKRKHRTIDYSELGIVEPHVVHFSVRAKEASNDESDGGRPRPKLESRSFEALRNPDSEIAEWVYEVLPLLDDKYETLLDVGPIRERIIALKDRVTAVRAAAERPDKFIRGRS